MENRQFINYYWSNIDLISNIVLLIYIAFESFTHAGKPDDMIPCLVVARHSCLILSDSSMFESSCTLNPTHRLTQISWNEGCASHNSCSYNPQANFKKLHDIILLATKFVKLITKLVQKIKGGKPGNRYTSTHPISGHPHKKTNQIINVHYHQEWPFIHYDLWPEQIGLKWIIFLCVFILYSHHTTRKCTQHLA